MENSLAFRLRTLRTHLNLSLKIFAETCNLSHVSIYNIENYKTLNPNKKTLQSISKNFNVNKSWLLAGKGEMLMNTQEIKDSNTALSSKNKDAISLLEIENKKLNLKIQRLWALIEYLTEKGQAKTAELPRNGSASSSK